MFQLACCWRLPLDVRRWNFVVRRLADEGPSCVTSHRGLGQLNGFLWENKEKNCALVLGFGRVAPVGPEHVSSLPHFLD